MKKLLILALLAVLVAGFGSNLLACDGDHGEGGGKGEAVSGTEK